MSGRGIEAGGRQYTGRSSYLREANVWVIFLEAGVALLLLLIIVWATWPRREQEKERADEDE